MLKMKYVGNGETGLTVNNVYPILFVNGSVGSPRGIIINDAGNLYNTAESLLTTSQWVVDSASYIGCVSI